MTLAVGSERGSIDLLAWRASTRTLLVVEIKTVLASSEAMLRTLDVKVRLAPILAGRFGWRPATIGQMVVLPATRTNRRHVRALATLVGPHLQVQARTVRRWLRDPAGGLNAIWVLTTSSGSGAGRELGGFQRVRGPRKARAASDPRSAREPAGTTAADP